MMMQAKAKVKWDPKNNGFRVTFILFGTQYTLFCVEQEPWQYLKSEQPFAEPAFDEFSPYFGMPRSELGVLDALVNFQLQVFNQRKQCPQVISHTEYLRTALPG